MENSPSGENGNIGALEQAMSELRVTLEGTNRAREEALRLSREVIQYSSRAIRAIHRGETQTANALVGEARSRTVAVRSSLQNHPDLFYAGYIHDSQKEYVEAEAMLRLSAASLAPAFRAASGTRRVFERYGGSGQRKPQARSG